MPAARGMLGTLSIAARGAILACSAAVTAMPPAHAQSLDVSGYVLTLAAHAGSSPMGPGGSTVLGRGRVMPTLALPGWKMEVAYEHVATRTPAGGGLATVPGGEGAGDGDWLGTDWEVASWARGSWRHRLDRLALSWDGGRTTLTVGRQAISWATTLFLTPADPFSPFDPSDPFREYRAGVDAVRLRVFPGPFSEVEAVVRAADSPEGTRTTALARLQTGVGTWSVGGWAGAVHDQAGAALFATGAAGATALRAEASVRKRAAGGSAIRGALGADRRFSAGGRDASVVAEIQYDGFGARDPEELAQVVRSTPFLRGEMQVLGQWTGAVHGSWQAHPLVSLDAMVLAALGDGSALLAPGLSWSATAAASLRAGLYTGIGPSGSLAAGGPESEYGNVPVLGYLALSWFF